METEEEAPSKEEEEKESSSAHDRNRRTAIERLRVGGRAERKTGRRGGGGSGSGLCRPWDEP